MQMTQDLLLLYAGEDHRGETNQAIAQYCLAHFATMGSETITHLAGACHVSPATITRFCHMLGYDDFLHFKDECRLNHRIRNAFYGQLPRVLGDDWCDFSPTALGASVQALASNVESCLAGVDEACLRQLAGEILAARDVLLLGIEFSALTALYLQLELNKRGKITRVLRDTANLNKVRVDHDTLLVLFSMSGYGLDILQDALVRLRERSGGLWLVTTNPALTHRPYVTQALCAGNSSYRYRRYAELALADMLLAAYGHGPLPYGPQEPMA